MTESGLPQRRRLVPYARYRPSGARWLGDIPAGWRVRRLKHVAAVSFSSVDKHTLEGEASVRLCNYVDVYYNNHITPDLEFMEATAAAEEKAKFALKEGDVLVTKDSEEWDDIAVSARVGAGLDGVLCGYHLALIRPIPDVLDGAYLFRAFSARGINDQFRVEATGVTRYGLSKYGLDNGLFPVPPVDEQRAIAAFLDCETARIDGLIAKKERQIELLEEKRAALISHAVTKGLDPAVKMKDSGIAWLGRIPAHWDLPPLYARYTVELGKMLDAKRITGEHLLPYLRNIDVQWDRVSVEDLPEMDIASDEYARYTLNEGDLLICEGGEVGRAATWRGELSVCGFQKAIHRVRPRTGRDLPRFLYYVMRAAASSNVFVAYGNPNTIAHLTAEKLRVYRFAFPPLDEQGAIVERLDGEAGRIDTLAAKLRTSIATLREYRTALISAAVTGKIDVGTTASAAKPAARANPYFRRAVLAAEIVYRLHADQKFGRVKLQKILYLCQHHLAMDLSGNFQRDAAGPFDNQMMRSVESQMARSRWYRRVAQGQRSTYVPMAKAGQHRTYFDRYWDQETVDALVELVRPMTTEQVEIVATLFAAWNDLILAGIPFSDDGVIHEVRTNWHESKERFTEDRLRKAMQWMRDKGMVPQGRGRATTLRSAGDGESGEE